MRFWNLDKQKLLIETKKHQYESNQKSIFKKKNIS